MFHLCSVFGGRFFFFFQRPITGIHRGQFFLYLSRAPITRYCEIVHFDNRGITYRPIRRPVSERYRNFIEFEGHSFQTVSPPFLSRIRTLVAVYYGWVRRWVRCFRSLHGTPGSNHFVGIPTFWSYFELSFLSLASMQSETMLPIY